MKRKILIFTVSVFLISIIGVIMSYTHFGHVEKLFDDVNNLNKFVAMEKNLLGTRVKDKNISGFNIDNGTIDNAHWKNIDLNHSTIKDTVIKNSEFTETNFSNSTLTNVKFEHVKFIGTNPLPSLLFATVWFDNCVFKNVEFVDCALNGITIRRLNDSNITFIDSKLKDVDLDESKLQFQVKNSVFEHVEPTKLKPGSNFHMHGGKLIHANFNSADFDNFDLDNVDVDGSYTAGKAKKITISSCKIAFNLNATTVDNLYVSKSEITNLTLYGLTANNTSIRDCKALHTEAFGFFKAKLNKLTINNCEANAIDFRQANIDELNLTDVSFKNSFSDHLLVNTAKLDGVEMSGDIDLSGAYIEKLYTRNAKNGQAKIKFDGSNLEYSDYYGLKLKGISPSKNYEGWWFSQVKQ
jgi:uncharacterized protein YjbI with pentapeptide repeats